MATYTIELGKLLTLDGFNIGMKDYPLPSFLHSAGDMQAWREALNQKIINHYYFNEICCLPPERFKFFLNNTLNEKMPYFNMLYDAMAEKWQFYTGGTLTEVVKADGTSSDNGTKTGTDVLARSGIDTTVNSSTQNNSHNDYTLNVNSDTPAQMLNIESDIAYNTYASSANKIKITALTQVTVTAQIPPLITAKKQPHSMNTPQQTDSTMTTGTEPCLA